MDNVEDNWDAIEAYNEMWAAMYNQIMEVTDGGGDSGVGGDVGRGNGCASVLGTDSREG